MWENGVGRTLPWDIGRVVALRAAPRGKHIAIANHRNEVLIGDLASGTLTVIDKSDAGRSEDFAWSPDGAWLAYTFWTSPRHCAIKLHDLKNAKSVLATSPEFRDYSPAFDPEGRYLYFLSVHIRSRLRQRPVRVELPARRAPYLIALAAAAPAVRSGAQGDEAGGPGQGYRQCKPGAPAAQGGPRRSRTARRAVPGSGGPVWTNRRRGGQQGVLDVDADPGRARARRTQGVARTTRGLRFRDRAERTADGQGRHVRARRRQHDDRRARRQAPARDFRAAREGRAPRS